MVGPRNEEEMIHAIYKNNFSGRATVFSLYGPLRGKDFSREGEEIYPRALTLSS
jgi:hypothetical protein